MKIISTLLLLALSFNFISAQTVNDVPMDSIDVEYVRIVGTARLLSPNKVTIELDFGQKNKFWVAKDTQVRDENNKLVVFNSMIDALNFMAEYG